MENEELNEVLLKLWDSLTDEQKEKAKACKTADELIKFAGEEAIELPDEMLDQVASGHIYKSTDPRSSMPWRVIDSKTGEEITGFATYDEAYEYSKKNLYGTDNLYWDDVQKIRDEYQAKQERKSQGC